MTPEEQFTNLRNTLDTMAEHMARHDSVMARHESAMAIHEAAIRDLIVVSRTVLTSIQEIKVVQVNDREDWKARMNKLHEAQAATDEKLNILINTVDRIIRQRNG